MMTSLSSNKYMYMDVDYEKKIFELHQCKNVFFADMICDFLKMIQIPPDLWKFNLCFYFFFGKLESLKL